MSEVRQGVGRGENARKSAGPALRRPSGTLANLTLHTLRLQSRGALIWGAVLGLYSAAMTATFTSFGDPEQMEQIMEGSPQGLMEALGVTDMSTIEGFLSSQVFNLAPLALAFFPILALAGAIAGAEERGSIDVLLGNPLPRWQLVVGNALATAVSLLGIIAVTGLMTWGTALLLDIDLSATAAAEGVLNLWPICMFFGGVALLCSAIFHRRVFAIAGPGMLLLGMYLLDAVANVSADLADYQGASVFYHYGSAITDGIDWTAFAGISGAALVLVALAVLVFQRRDIYT